MKLGFQYNYAFPVQWIPIDSNPPKIRETIGKNGIKTEKGIWITGYIAKSYYCEDCGLIITPV